VAAALSGKFVADNAGRLEYIIAWRTTCW